MPWNEQLMKADLEQHMHSGVVWIPDMAIIVSLSSKVGEGGYGVIKKVHIANMDGIPVYIKLTCKESKAKTEWKKREERSIEALVCLVQHPGVIKFWTIYSITMEAYTLWWNGESLRSFLCENSKASKVIDYDAILALRHLDMPLLERIVAYRKNRAMLAWALIYIMHLVHNAKIIHNDLTKSNVLLHFPPNDVHNVYFGVCDWGLASQVVEYKSSPFHDKSEAERIAHRHKRPGMAPELFFVYAERGNSERNLESMKKKHPYTMASDAFAVGYLAKTIRRYKHSDNLLKDEVKHVGFALKLDALVDEDPKKRPTLAKVVEILMSPPYNFPIPEKCFRTKL